jgi:hypothetical protein
VEILKAALVLVDIGGYTRFITMHKTSLIHAERIITDLLESVINTAQYPLTLNKLEGDAVLFYATTGWETASVLRSAFGQAEGFFAAFHRKRGELAKVDPCPCDACRNVGQLRIKAILHYGELALKRVWRFDELAGEPVIVAHRLLKNSVRKDEYLLATEIFEQGAGGLREGGERRQEQYEGIGVVPVVVFDPPAEPTLPEYHPTPIRRALRHAYLLGYTGLRNLGVIRARDFKSLAGV